MRAHDFIAWLDQLDGDDIDRIARAIRAEADTADGEVSWWRATVAIGTELRRQRRSREAGIVAHDVSTSVLHHAEQLGLLADDHSAATLVARAAAEVVRGLLAGSASRVQVDVLLGPFRQAAPIAA